MKSDGQLRCKSKVLEDLRDTFRGQSRGSLRRLVPPQVYPLLDANLAVHLSTARLLTFTQAAGIVGMHLPMTCFRKGISYWASGVPSKCQPLEHTTSFYYCSRTHTSLLGFRTSGFHPATDRSFCLAWRAILWGMTILSRPFDYSAWDEVRRPIPSASRIAS
jgi:hypothetical protein